MLDFASKRKEAELRSGIVRNNSFWDKVIFRKIQVCLKLSLFLLWILDLFYCITYFFHDYFWKSSRCAYLITEQQYDVFSNTGSVIHHYISHKNYVGISLQLLNLIWVVII